MSRDLWIGDWLVEPDLNRISKAGVQIPVEPKVIEVLLYLADHAGEVLSKKEIIQTVWAGTFVSKEVLSYSISELRKAFGDDAKNPRIIQTIHRRGYRLIAPVTQHAPTIKAQPSVAVLAFLDMSPKGDQEYFCSGMAEEIINNLSRVKDLRVAARTSSFAFKGGSEDIPSIGRKLNVATVLEGSVRKAANQLRISAQLVKVEDGYQLWSGRYDRELKDVFAVQAEIARKIVQALKIQLSDNEERSLDRMPTKNVEAFDFYIRGRQFFYRSKRRGIECAIEMFSHATEKDPEYALAYAGMADCYSYLYMYFDNKPGNLDLARQLSRKALDLDPELAEAHSARGLAVSLSRQYAQAEKEFEAALQLNPMQFEAYYFYGRTCFVQGKLEKAESLFEQAEQVKPEDCQAPSLLAFVSGILGHKKKHEAAARRTLAKVEKNLEFNPDDSRALYLGADALSVLGNHAKAFEWIQKCYSLDPDDPYIVYGIACFYSQLRKIEEALFYFEKAVHAGFTQLEWIENDTDFDPIRKHPRFLSIVAELEKQRNAGQ
ncbi:MAG: winged helix-turn-helix domain-containing protein [Acidobacteria bacterium]|nr:winged helix-turn-helix domain-containing protein [Acidobacteriota bacterium]